jgi:Flp pilus assembly protein TadB
VKRCGDDMMLIAIVVLFFLSITILIYQVFKIKSNEEQSTNRIKKYLYSEQREKRIQIEKERSVGSGLSIISDRIKHLKFLEGYKSRLKQS